MSLLIWIASVALVAATAGAGPPPERPATDVDRTPIRMLSLWPNDALDRAYGLHQGAPTAPDRTIAAYWMEHPDAWSFLASNSRPFGRCNQDLYRIVAAGEIAYAETAHDCDGDDERYVLEPPMVFFPARWYVADGPWRRAGSVSAKFYVDGLLEVEGRNDYVNEIIGFEVTGPGRIELHWRSRQSIHWTSGKYAGYTTRWEENWWFGEVPVEGAEPAPGLARTMGGNLDQPWPQWDIRFERWRPLAPPFTDGPIIVRGERQSAGKSLPTERSQDEWPRSRSLFEQLAPMGGLTGQE